MKVLFYWYGGESKPDKICISDLKTGQQCTLILDDTKSSWRYRQHNWDSVQQIKDANLGKSAMILDIWEE